MLQSPRPRATSHYSLSLDPAALMTSAEDHAVRLLDSLRDNEVPVLIYRGFSGVAAATAVALALHTKGAPCGMVYVRKEDEGSHGLTAYERSLPALKQGQEFIRVFVDDFCESGGTRQKAIDGAAGTADYVPGIITVSLGNNRGRFCGIWRHGYEAVCERFGIGCG